jgi:alkanesulfonate monooxygenase SsuD/methylene tetrahydromethanopterin reductase-like flavin-dependent oxidoreductase (luciferase family)
MMYFGIDVPNHGEYGDPHVLLQLAQDTEEAGWDGFFTWDHIVKYNDNRIPVADPWVVLSAVAVKTSRIRIGTMVTPIARRRPWKLAKETVTLDHLSEGRLILGIGLGARSHAEFGVFGDESDPKLRAEIVDESLQVITGLWSGETFRFKGEHFSIDETRFRPRPIQSPRIPIWIAGTWPNTKPMQRAARWDGAFPIGVGHSYISMLSPEEIADVAAYIKTQNNVDSHFDIVHLGFTHGEDELNDAEIVSQYAQAGVTWWLENINPTRGSIDRMRQRILKGPPKIELED